MRRAILLGLALAAVSAGSGTLPALAQDDPTARQRFILQREQEIRRERERLEERQQERRDRRLEWREEREDLREAARRRAAEREAEASRQRYDDYPP